MTHMQSYCAKDPRAETAQSLSRSLNCAAGSLTTNKVNRGQEHHTESYTDLNINYTQSALGLTWRWGELTHAEVSTHHCTLLLHHRHLKTAPCSSSDDVIMLEACNKSSGVWQLATLLPAFMPAGVANFSGLFPIQAQNPPPREGMV